MTFIFLEAGRMPSIMIKASQKGENSKLCFCSPVKKVYDMFSYRFLPLRSGRQDLNAITLYYLGEGDYEVSLANSSCRGIMNLVLGVSLITYVFLNV